MGKEIYGFLVSLPHTHKGQDAIWVVAVDSLTKLARCIRTKTTVSTRQLAYQFIDKLFCFHGLLMSDRDSMFASDF